MRPDVHLADSSLDIGEDDEAEEERLYREHANSAERVQGRRRSLNEQPGSRNVRRREEDEEEIDSNKETTLDESVVQYEDS